MKVYHKTNKIVGFPSVKNILKRIRSSVKTKEDVADAVSKAYFAGVEAGYQRGCIDTKKRIYDALENYMNGDKGE